MGVHIMYLFNFVKRKSVIISYKINGNTKVAVSSGSPYSVQVCLSHSWEVKIDHNIYCLDVYTTGEQIYRHKMKVYVYSQQNL